jgi:hypothetical protein
MEEHPNILNEMEEDDYVRGREILVDWGHDECAMGWWQSF